MIDFKRTRDSRDVTNFLVNSIAKRLSNRQKVLWLVAGGSAMDVAVQAAALLKVNQNIGNLTVSLTDERYGPDGHKDSNWEQLQAKGFSLPGARLVPVLLNLDLHGTVGNYKRFLNEELDEVDFSIALAGMGPDGHIFGIKPGSPAVGSQETVIGYEWDDFVRITPTIKLIKRLDEVIIFAAGQEKHQQIDKLNSDDSAAKQPAQLLKQLKRVVFFNDYKGEDV